MKMSLEQRGEVLYRVVADFFHNVLVLDVTDLEHFRAFADTFAKASRLVNIVYCIKLLRVTGWSTYRQQELV